MRLWPRMRLRLTETEAGDHHRATLPACNLLPLLYINEIC